MPIRPAETPLEREGEIRLDSAMPSCYNGLMADYALIALFVLLLYVGIVWRKDNG